MSENLTKDLPPEGVELILASLRSMDTRLFSLEERVDRRLSETRPIWEQVLSRFGGIDERLGGIDERLGGIDERLSGIDERLNGFDKKLNGLDAKIENLGLDMRAGFKRLGRQMAQLASDVVAVRTDQVDLERRMDRLEDKLEVKPAP